MFPPGQAVDRVRSSRIPSDIAPLTTVEEAFTSENWIIRIYKVKDLDTFNRDHPSAAAFAKGVRSRPTRRRQVRQLREV